MKLGVEYGVFCLAAVIALFTAHFFLFFVLIGLIFIWEDSKWPAFDSKDYDRKMMRAPLKPWQKGN